MLRDIDLSGFTKISAKNPPREGLVASGHRACQGCVEVLAMQMVTRAVGKHAIVVSATGCMEIVTSPYPQSAWKCPWIHVAFENAAAVASGVEAGLLALIRKGKRKGPLPTILAFAGDGGTADIGMQALSGAMDRGHKIIYVCMDNEAYMNTGVQRSSATPPAARTATTPAMGTEPGNTFGQGKNVPLIAMAHGIPYVATASVADLRDLEAKVTRAMGLRGARYIHILVPCPLGWGSEPHATIAVARLAIESGLFPVFEAEHGEVTGRRTIRRRVPVEEYLGVQRRFAHLLRPVKRVEVIARIQAMAERNIRRFGLLGEEESRA